MPGLELWDKSEVGSVEATLRSVELRNSRVHNFETTVARYVGAKYAVAVSSGTAALHLALLALGVGPGDEVITQAHTFVATVEAILMCGATPVITEVDESLNMDPLDLGQKITAKTKVVIPVHMGGVPCDMGKIRDVILRGINIYGNIIRTLEDSAQSFGATLHGKHCGRLAHTGLGIYSFDLGKTITTGEGGMIVTDREEFADTVRQLRDHGHLDIKSPRGLDHAKRWGYNYKLNPVAAAIGLAQMDKIDTILKGQDENYWKLDELMIEEIWALHPEAIIPTRPRPEWVHGTGDTLIFFCKDEKQAQRVASKVPTKNLPDALRWHFAGHWTHMFKSWNQMIDPSEPHTASRLHTHWPRSWDLLHRAVALPVSCRPMDIEGIVQQVKEGLDAK